MDAQQISALDQQHLWHPYSSFGSFPPPWPVASASGCTLKLADGRKLLDGMASWWSVIHGYNNRALNQAITDQLEQMSHVMFGGLTHEPAARLGKKLAELAPENLNRVFLSDSGSVSVEVAIKMALQYWQSRGKPRHRLLTVRKGYHGDTFATMGVCDPDTGMHHLFANDLKQHLFADAPPGGFDQKITNNDMASLSGLLEKHQHEIAAIILEPIVQGAGGMRFYSPEYLRQVRSLCDHYGILLILDEIATGFGRTGKLFACEHANIKPDIMCLGKALTGGYMTLAATLCSDQVAETICKGEAGVFMHGPTFMGNPLACAAANASIDLLLAGDWQANIGRLEDGLREGLLPAADIQQVADVRCLGGIGVIELREPAVMADIQHRFVDEGVWVRPFGKLVYVMPPYIMTNDELGFLTHKMVKVISEIDE